MDGFAAMGKVFRGSTGRNYVGREVFSVLPLGFISAIVNGMFHGSIDSCVNVRVLIGSGTSYLNFFLISVRRAFFRFMSMKDGAAIPFALADFLSSTFRHLGASVLALGLNGHEGRKGRRLANVFKEVGTVLRAGRVSVRVLRRLWNERRVYHVSTGA